jgi:chromosome segregation ATPase
MAETGNVVLEHLRHIRGAIDGLREDMPEVKQRLGILENQCANLEIQYASVFSRLDRMDGRIERIERRLDLTDA